MKSSMVLTSFGGPQQRTPWCNPVFAITPPTILPFPCHEKGLSYPFFAITKASSFLVEGMVEKWGCLGVPYAPMSTYISSSLPAGWTMPGQAYSLKGHSHRGYSWVENARQWSKSLTSVRTSSTGAVVSRAFFFSLMPSQSWTDFFVVVNTRSILSQFFNDQSVSFSHMKMKAQLWREKYQVEHFKHSCCTNGILVVSLKVWALMWSIIIVTLNTICWKLSEVYHLILLSKALRYSSYQSMLKGF